MIKRLSLLEWNGFQYAMMETLEWGRISEKAEALVPAPKLAPEKRTCTYLLYQGPRKTESSLARARRRTMRSGVAEATCSFVLYTVTWLRDENKA